MPHPSRPHALAPFARRTAAVLVPLLGLTTNPIHAAVTLGDDTLGLIVPAYFYPGGSGLQYWQDMNAVADDVPLIAIMNPNSGPGTSTDPNYVSAVNDLRAAGGTVIGYVSTAYTNRAANLIKSDIDAYVDRYNLDGIFLDEFTNTSNPADLDFYEDLYGYIKHINPDWTVVGNPGTRTTEPYLSRPVADIVMVYEQVAANYPGHTPASWNFDVPADRLSHLVHTQPSEAAMLANLDQAVQQNAGWMYVTDDVLGNPWDRLPTYWDAQVQRTIDINDAGPINPVDPPVKPGGLELRYNPVANGSINVNDTPGSRDGWDAAQPFSKDPALDANPQVDFTALTVAHDDIDLFFRVGRDPAASNPLDFNQNIFIDADQNRDTGFTGGGGFLPIGVDYLLQASTLYAFANGANQTAWGWSAVASLDADDQPTTDLEIALARNLLGDPVAVDLILNAANTGPASVEDYYPDNPAAGQYFTYAFVTQAAARAGDFNDNGTVEQADLDLVLANWGAAATPTTFLANTQGLTEGVDQDELDAVLSNWGSSTAPSFAGSSLPEPATALLGLLGASALRRRQW